MTKNTFKFRGVFFVAFAIFMALFVSCGDEAGKDATENNIFDDGFKEKVCAYINDVEAPISSMHETFSIKKDEVEFSDIFYDDKCYYFVFKVGGVENVEVEPCGGFNFKYGGRGTLSYTYTTEKVTENSVAKQNTTIDSRLEYEDKNKGWEKHGNGGLTIPLEEVTTAFSVSGSMGEQYYQNTTTKSKTGIYTDTTSTTLAESTKNQLRLDSGMPAGYYKVCQAVDYDAFCICQVPFSETEGELVFDTDETTWNSSLLPMPRRKIETLIAYSKTRFTDIAESDLDMKIDSELFRMVAEKIKEKKFDISKKENLTGRFGKGTVEDPYLICYASDLTKIKDAISANTHYIMINDIDMSEIEWTPMQSFSGTIDFRGHSIKNLSYEKNDFLGGKIGLFLQRVGRNRCDKKSSPR